MEKVTLPARTAESDDGYVATIDNLSLTGRGSTVKGAQDDLVEEFISWVQTWEGQGALATLLSKAGYAELDDDTELELQFLD